jgi:hypothetical protein
MGDFIQIYCRHCRQTYVTTAADLQQCDLCRKVGGLVSPEAAFDEEAQRAFEQAQREREPQRVSSTCPSCGGGEFRSVRPERWIAFTWDRVCKSCGTRYTPPTPRWAGLVFILIGLPLAGLGLFGAILGLAGGNPFALACEGALGLLGALAIVHGLRSLLSPGRV